MYRWDVCALMMVLVCSSDLSAGQGQSLDARTDRTTKAPERSSFVPLLTRPQSEPRLRLLAQNTDTVIAKKPLHSSDPLSHACSDEKNKAIVSLPVVTLSDIIRTLFDTSSGEVIKYLESYIAQESTLLGSAIMPCIAAHSEYNAERSYAIAFAILTHSQVSLALKQQLVAEVDSNGHLAASIAAGHGNAPLVTLFLSFDKNYKEHVLLVLQSAAKHEQHSVSTKIAQWLAMWEKRWDFNAQ